MAARYLPDIGFVREALSYDPDTGIFIWRERPAHHFPDAKTWNPQTWNTRFAGKRAGSTNQAGPRRIFWEISLGFPGTFKAHRLAWLLVYGEPVPELIDHINADSTDNRIANLRVADKSSNGMNQRVFDKEQERRQRRLQVYEAISQDAVHGLPHSEGTEAPPWLLRH